MEQEPILPAPVEAPSKSGGESASRRGVGVSTSEASPTAVERAPGGAETVPAVQPQPVTMQPVQAANDSSQMPASDSGATAASNDNSSPAVADDVDVIEKEWVDKAKKIVSSTKEDPYQQEKAVSKLQADYLMKRYGKKVKLVE